MTNSSSPAQANNYFTNLDPQYFQLILTNIELLQNNCIIDHDSRQVCSGEFY
jgi:hypothetical protein